MDEVEKSWQCRNTFLYGIMAYPAKIYFNICYT